MSDVAIRMAHVYKKFRKGEVFNSLRDLIPALTGRMFRQQELSPMDKREFWALEDISLEVAHGEAIGIIGANGAGKSTMLKLISRVMKPTSGTIEVKGRASALIDVGAGFHPDLTGRENIYLNGSILGMSRREIDAKFDRIVDFSGLAEFIDTPVKRYSSGMYARLGFSVAAHVDPDVLIVDEVLSVGDYVFQQKCVQRMKDVIRSGCTVLFVSHNTRNIVEFCHRCLLIQQGRLLISGSPTDVLGLYIKNSRVTRDRACLSNVEILHVCMRNGDGESMRFESGEMAWMDIKVTAHRPCAKMAVAIGFMDESYYEVFNTSTERLGCGNFSLDKGDTFTCSFELELNLASGTFQAVVAVYRYDTETLYDRWESAACFYVEAAHDARGAVNCFPRVIRHAVLKADIASQDELLTEIGEDTGT